MNRCTSPPYIFYVGCPINCQYCANAYSSRGKIVNCKRTSTAVKLFKPNRDFEISYVELPPESKRSQALDVSLDILCVSRKIMDSGSGIVRTPFSKHDRS